MAAEAERPKSWRALLLRRAGTYRQAERWKDGSGDDRIGARAFLHLGGLCEPGL